MRFSKSPPPSKKNYHPFIPKMFRICFLTKSSPTRRQIIMTKSAQILNSTVWLEPTIGWQIELRPLFHLTTVPRCGLRFVPNFVTFGNSAEMSIALFSAFCYIWQQWQCVDCSLFFAFWFIWQQCRGVDYILFRSATVPWSRFFPHFCFVWQQCRKEGRGLKHPRLMRDDNPPIPYL
jgi:hypothetical protein